LGALANYSFHKMATAACAPRSASCGQLLPLGSCSPWLAAVVTTPATETRSTPALRQVGIRECTTPYRPRAFDTVDATEARRSAHARLDLDQCKCSAKAVGGRMFVKLSAKFGMLVTAAVMSSPLPAAAGWVFFVPSVRAPDPPPATYSAQPALQWAPPPARGFQPGHRSPVARCYAGVNVCPLQQPDQVGQSCTCTSAGGRVLGRALIPPSHDVSGGALRTD
jgi:hypothetical protein